MLGLQGVEMVMLGFNTPSVNSQNRGEGLAKRMFHHKLSLQAGAYQNSTWVVAVAKCGVEDGHHCMAGTVIVNPDGEIVAETTTEDDELLVHDCDLDATAVRQGNHVRFRPPPAHRALRPDRQPDRHRAAEGVARLWLARFWRRARCACGVRCRRNVIPKSADFSDKMMPKLEGLKAFIRFKLNG